MKRVLIHLILILLFVGIINSLLEKFCPDMDDNTRGTLMLLLFVFIYIFLAFFNFFSFGTVIED